jgi:hypothetical protein
MVHDGKKNVSLVKKKYCQMRRSTYAPTSWVKDPFFENKVSFWQQGCVAQKKDGKICLADALPVQKNERKCSCWRQSNSVSE